MNTSHEDKSKAIRETLIVLKYVFSSYKQVPAIWLGFLSKLIENFFGKCVLVILFGKILASYIQGNNSATISLLILTSISLICVPLIGLIGEYFFVKYSDKQYRVLVEEFHSNLISKRISFFNKETAGSINNLFRDHLNGTIGIIRFLRGDGLSLLSSFIFPIITLAFYDPIISILMIIFALSEWGVNNWISRRVKLNRKKADQVYDQLTSTIIDQFFNIKLLKASGRENHFRHCINNLASQEEMQFSSRHRKEAIYEFLNAIMISFGFILILFEINLRGNNTLENIEITTITILYMLQINFAVNNFSDTFKKIQERLDKVYKSLTVINSENFSEHGSLETKFFHTEYSQQASSIKFENVYFSYEDNKGRKIKVFQDLNIEIEAGCHCALVGESGVGKSTLGYLLLKLYDIESGSIYIDGKEISEYSLEQLRKDKISYMPSELQLFNTTILENLILFDPTASMEKVIAACKCAHIHDFISGLDEGYNSLIRENGVNLSNGQKQRIGIARTILKHGATIFIFDEMTSALDKTTANKLVKEITDYLAGKTVLFITHDVNFASLMQKEISITKLI
ncbi:MAG: ABC transporter ATP-binding protein [Bacteroidetes bacterium]|nr:ABC transporter ATP-binding protein [Bacteroidota bacterium]